MPILVMTGLGNGQILSMIQILVKQSSFFSKPAKLLGCRHEGGAIVSFLF